MGRCWRSRRARCRRWRKGSRTAGYGGCFAACHVRLAAGNGRAVRGGLIAAAAADGGVFAGRHVTVTPAYRRADFAGHIRQATTHSGEGRVRGHSIRIPGLIVGPAADGAIIVGDSIVTTGKAASPR